MDDNLKILLDELEDVIYVSDPTTYELLYMNRSAARLFNGPDYHGQKCYRVLQGKEQPCDFCTNLLLKRDSYHCWEAVNPRLQRSFFCKDKLIDWYGRPARLEIALDITGRGEAGKRTVEKLRAEDTLVKCIHSLVLAESLDEGILAVLAEVGTFFLADRAYVFEAGENLGSFSNTYEWCGEGVAPQRERLQNITSDVIARWSRSFERREPVIIRDIEQLRRENPKEYELLHDLQGIHSLYAVPLWASDELCGFVGIDNPQYSLDDIMVLESLSYFISHQMVEQRLRAEQEYLSYHDALTGVYNRHKYTEYLERFQPQQLQSLGVVYIDINGLKTYNDKYGHTHGDMLIRQMVDVLHEVFAVDGIYRLSGDEFILLCQDMAHHDFLERIQKMRARTLAITGMSLAVGYTWADRDIDLHQLIRHADELMYVDKREHYRQGSTAHTHQQEVLENVVQAIQNGRFIAYLQPKVEVATEKVVEAELLSRLNHPTMGLTGPDFFVGALEEYHFIRYLDLYMFEEACKLLGRWRAQGRSPIALAVNFSRVTLLEYNIVDTLLEIVAPYQIPNELLKIEVTESVGEMERETVLKIGRDLKRVGFGISLDDFGARYTNMSMLAVMPMDELKLDRSMVTDLTDNARNRLVVQHIIQICHELRIKIVAEGVETRAQFEVLRQMHCDIVQGFLFGRPSAVETFEQEFLPK